MMIAKYRIVKRQDRYIAQERDFIFFWRDCYPFDSFKDAEDHVEKWIKQEQERKEKDIAIKYYNRD